MRATQASVEYMANSQVWQSQLEPKLAYHASDQKTRKSNQLRSDIVVQVRIPLLTCLVWSGASSPEPQGISRAPYELIRTPLC